MTRTEKSGERKEGNNSSLSLGYWKIFISEVWVKQMYFTYKEHKNCKCCFIEEKMCLYISQAHFQFDKHWFLLRWLLYDEYLLNFLNLSCTLALKPGELEEVDFLRLHIRSCSFKTVLIKDEQNAPVCPLCHLAGADNRWTWAVLCGFVSFWFAEFCFS